MEYLASGSSASVEKPVGCIIVVVIITIFIILHLRETVYSITSFQKGLLCNLDYLELFFNAEI